jgi:ABC-2 type transport system ATP-binding protein
MSFASRPPRFFHTPSPHVEEGWEGGCKRSDTALVAPLPPQPAPIKGAGEMNGAVLTGEGVPALEIRGLSYSYGKRPALTEIEVELPAGRFVVLLGPNGAGKTTLFSLVTRLFATQGGTIRVFGHDNQRAPGAALSVLGVVFQQRTLDLDLTAGQNLVYHAALHGMAFGEGRRRAREELVRTGLAAEIGRKVRQLSGGQLRRVEIARALLHRPKLLLCDEATVGLDIGSRAELLGYVRDLVRERQLTILWATHLVDEVEPEDRMIVLHKGRILRHGPCREVVAETGEATIGAALSRLWGGRNGEAA